MGLGAIGKLTVMFGADMKGLNKGLKKAHKNLSKFSKTVGRNLVLPMVAFAAASVKAFDTQIKAETKLLTALKGKGDVQQRLIEQAQALQQMTLFGDEETIAAQAMLATMGLEEEAIKRLIPLVQDMAVAKGMDLVQAADLVAKSVGSSTNALSRYGIEITGAVGSTERLDSAVGSLTQMFKGQAEAISKEGLGPLTQLKNTLGDVSEEFGKIILDGLVPFTNKMKEISKALKGLTPEQKKFAVQMGAVTIAVTAIVAALGLLAGAITAIIGLFTTFGAIPIVAALTAITLGVALLVKKFKGKGELKDSVKETNDEVNNLIITFDKFGRMKTQLGARFPDPAGFFSGGGDTPTTPTTPKREKLPIVEQIERLGPVLLETSRAWKTYYEEMAGSSNIWDETQAKIESINLELKQNFEGALYSAMTAQENFFDAFLRNLKRAIGQMIAMHAAQSITNALFGTMTGDAGGGIGGIFAKILGFHKGGLVSGPTLGLIGEGAGTSISNPEVVAPLDKLKSMMGSGIQTVEVQGRLSGNDIWLSNSKTTNTRQRSI